MHKRLDIIIVLLVVTAILLVVSICTGCSTTRGLHSENRGKNNATRWQQYNEHGQHYVR